MRYWERAAICSLTPTKISPKAIRLIKTLVSILYTVVITSMSILALATFPGFLNNDSLD
jgi:hypothetical protein